jgi:hypothetical protein
MKRVPVSCKQAYHVVHYVEEGNATMARKHTRSRQIPAGQRALEPRTPGVRYVLRDVAIHTTHHKAAPSDAAALPERVSDPSAEDVS